MATALLLAAAAPPPAASASAPQPAAQDGTVAAQVDRFLTARLEDSAIPGAAVAVTRGDRVLMVRGYGHDSTDTSVTGDSPPASGPHTAARIDAVLAMLTLAALAFGACGVVRAGRWVRRRRSTPLPALLSVLPPAFVLGAGAAIPWLATAWIRRDVTWRAAAYEWPAVWMFVAAALIAAASTLLAWAWHWWRVHRADPPRVARARRPAPNPGPRSPSPDL